MSSYSGLWMGLERIAAILRIQIMALLTHSLLLNCQTKPTLFKDILLYRKLFFHPH